MGLIRDRQTAQGDAKTQLEGFLPGNAVRIPTNWGGRNHVLFFWNKKSAGKKKEALGKCSIFFNEWSVDGFVFWHGRFVPIEIEGRYPE